MDGNIGKVDTICLKNYSHYSIILVFNSESK